MKIVKIDIFDQKAIADVLVADNITDPYLGDIITKALNAHIDPRNIVGQDEEGDDIVAPKDWYKLVDDDYKLRPAEA